MTPEARARAVYELIKADPFGDAPLKAISDAIAAAERAAYERAAEVVRLENYSLYLEILDPIDKEPT